MLDVTILKVYHATEKEAKKLRPYIEKCDVFSPEGSLALDKEVDKEENKWNEALKTVSRSRIKKWLENNNDNSHLINAEIIAYRAKMFDQLYISKRLLWHVERFSDEELKILRLIQKDYFIKHENSFQHLRNGNSTVFLNDLWASIQRQGELVKIRD